MNRSTFAYSKVSESIAQRYEAFWRWFAQNAERFYEVVATSGNIESDFFAPLSAEIEKIHDGIFFQVGKLANGISELVLTAEGRVSHFVFVEDLVASAPAIDKWIFKAHKAAIPLSDFEINMDGLTFGKNNIWFYARQEDGFPDEINLVLLHGEFNAENAEAVSRGCIVFLDTLLGELNAVSLLDSVAVTSKEAAEEDLIPIEKLHDYLNWRQKEFIERYESARRTTSNDRFAVMEGESEEGKVILAVINVDLLNWENKASHPWILKTEVTYQPDATGQPDEASYLEMENFETLIVDRLTADSGYLYIGRQTSDGIREIYFACREFRYCSRCMNDLRKNVAGTLKVTCEIYKDKYWRSLNHFSSSGEDQLL